MPPETPHARRDASPVATILNSLPSNLIRSRLGQRVLERVAGFYDSSICTPANVRKQAGKPRTGRQPRTRFSVAIPHYNRGALIYRPLFNLLCHPAVEEVVIVDDGSDPKEFAALEKALDDLGLRGRVVIHRRDLNLGALETKRECVERSSSEWVLILDSDNTVFNNYLDALASLKALSPDTFYCAGWAFPHFPFYEFEGLRIGFEMAGKLTNSGALRQVYVINDGNYLVHRESYVRSVSGIGGIASDVADVMLVNYRWLSHGGFLEVLKGPSYFHRVHEGSFWNLTQEDSRRRVAELFARFEAGIRWDGEFAASLRRAS